MINRSRAHKPGQFFFYCFGDHRDLHSFPTRRSSDLRPTARPASSGCHRHDRHAASEREARKRPPRDGRRSEEHTSELQSRGQIVCRLLLEKKKKKKKPIYPKKKHKTLT